MLAICSAIQIQQCVGRIVAVVLSDPNTWLTFKRLCLKLALFRCISYYSLLQMAIFPPVFIITAAVLLCGAFTGGQV